MNESVQTHGDASRGDAVVEPPGLEEHLHRTGFRLAASATAMFFLGFVFAYFYLRSLNNSQLWKPSGVDPPQLYGVLIVAAFVFSAIAFAYGSARSARGEGWVVPVGAALALGLAGCVLQAFEYAHLSFGPRSGGYGSVFIGWTSLYAVVVLLAMYRVETIFATGLRQGRQGAGYEPVGFGPASYYWTMLAGIGILAWVILYLI
jgi:heme/copper-type cytochrome/quinol oxidase subunit 3